MTSNLILLGASTRAAAFSARRAGLRPRCADLFADLDLSRCCEVTRLSAGEYPEGLVAAARHAPPGPWVYVGALENYPDLVGRIAVERTLWGNGPEVLGRVRDPFELAACFARAGLAFPEVRRTTDEITRDRSWLVKPLAGAGGRGIREFGAVSAVAELYDALQPESRGEGETERHGDGGTRRRGDAETDAGHFLQQRIEGLSCAAVFVGNGQQALLVGVTRQLIGERAFHAKPFHYCGSIGPLELERRVRQKCEAVGHALAAEFGLVGLFGVDGILCDGDFWPVEVNPRYTASVEILEHALGIPMLSLHREACLTGAIPEVAGTDAGIQPHRRGKMLGKAVLFSPVPFVAPDLAAWMETIGEHCGCWPMTRVADVPRAGTKLSAGSPVITAFASHQTEEGCFSQLIHEAERLYASFILAEAEQHSS